MKFKNYLNMKKNYYYLLSLLGLFSLNVEAQISVLSTDFVSVGDVVNRAKDTLPTVQLGPTGGSQVWDFSAVTEHTLETTLAVAPSSTPNGGSFPNANMALTQDNVSYVYANKTATEFILEGGVLDIDGNGTMLSANFNPTATSYQFPIEYLNQFTDNNGFQVVTSGASVGEPGIHSVRITYTATTHDSVDAYGYMKFPHGVEEVLRIKKRLISNTVIEFKLLSFSPWSQDPDSPYLGDDTFYYWVSKVGKLPVAELTFDENGNPNELIYTKETLDYCNFATVAPSNLVASNQTSTSIDLDWTAGDGSGVIVLAKKGSAITYNPSDSMTYVANSSYGDAAAAYGDAFVVYNGTGNQVTVTDLDPASNYYFQVYEYACNENYFRTNSANLTAGTLGAPSINFARIQMIHNSADLAANNVDIWINNTKEFANVAFRTATPFVDLVADEPFDVTIQPANSTDTVNGVYRINNAMLDSGETYIAVANGIVSASGYSPATPFSIELFGAGKETHGVANETSVLVYHGVTDAPAVDVYAEGVANPLVSNLAYADFDGYLDLNTADYILKVTAAGDTNAVARFKANLDSLNLGGTALTVLASGFLDPSVNSNGAEFGLWAALANGGPLVELPKVVAAPDDTTNVLNRLALENIKIYPNPTKNILNIDLTNVEINADFSLVIYSFTGAKVYEQNILNNNMLRLDLESFETGVYMLEIRNAQQTVGRTKLIKE